MQTFRLVHTQVDGDLCQEPHLIGGQAGKQKSTAVLAVRRPVVA